MLKKDNYTKLRINLRKIIIHISSSLKEKSSRWRKELVTYLKPEISRYRTYQSTAMDSVKGLMEKHSQWPLYAITVIIVFAAVLILLLQDKVGVRAQYGDFLAGFAGLLAFLWLIAGYRMQTQELRMQREELRLQRKVLELQTEELKRMSEFAGLEQIVTMIDRALKELPSEDLTFREVDKVAKPSDKWDIILTSLDAQVVYDTYSAYDDSVNFIDRFYVSYQRACIFYLNSVKKIQTRNYSTFLDDYWFVLHQTPYLSRHLSQMRAWADFKKQYSGKFNALQLAFYIAEEEVLEQSPSFNQVVIDYFYEEVVTADEELPAIAKDIDFPNSH